MNIRDDIPHVGFSFSSLDTNDADDQLTKLLKNQLEYRFDRIQVVSTWRWISSLSLILEVAGDQVAMVLGRSKHGEGEWKLLAGPPNRTTFIDRLLRRKVICNIPKLKLACRKIHEALISLPQISRVRWYFDGGGNQTEAVLTPDELPWKID